MCALYPIDTNIYKRKLDDLREESKKTGLEINSSKTEEVRVNTTVNQELQLNSEVIKR
jgi:hypothetical protein